VTIIGLDKLNRKLKTIPREAETAAKDAVVKGANEIAALQRSLVPVVDGDLQDSIHVTNPGESTPPYSQPGGQRTAKDLEAIVTAGNSKVRYAHLVEFGTAQHVNAGIFAGTKNPGTTARPFFWPGFRALRKRVKSRITRSINKAVREAAQKGGTNP
tara:strand:- start:121890 stop:122360 length:471 start_codon:yes stop_codon:yes gene_type:complete